MNRILAIASLTLRGAFRSRILVVLMILLAAAVIGLPLTVRGDGTPEGRVQILLSYTLGFAGFIASATALWSGCAAISAEVQDRQLQLVMTKPVRPIELWLGKWVGLMLLNALLIGFAGATTYGLLRWTMRPATQTPADAVKLREQILVARAQAYATVPDVDAAARTELDRRRSEGKLPADVDPATALEQIRKSLQIEACAVGPGMRRVREIDLPFVPGTDRPVFLQFRLSKSTFDMEDMRLRWSAGPSEDRPLWQAEGTYRSDTPITLSMPASAFDGGRRLVLSCENMDPGRTTFFDPENGIEVLAFRGTFAGNYARALLVMLLRLAFLSALGLAAGAVFSFPVAAFVSVSTLLIVALSGYVVQEEVLGAMPSISSATASLGGRAMRLFFLGLAKLTAPLQVSGTLDLLATGRLVTWTQVVTTLVSHVAISGGLLALLASGLFARRELAENR